MFIRPKSRLKVMTCPECQAEGPTGAVFCVGCGLSLQGQTMRRLRWLLGLTLMVTGFVVILAALGPMLLNHPGDWARLAAGCLLVPLGLASLYQRRCVHADGEGRSHCPECGLKTGRRANPFRLSLLVLASLALAILICALPVFFNPENLAEFL